MSDSLVLGMTPPPGVTPNFVDPPSTAPAATAITGISLGLMYCFLALRVYTRLWLTCSFGVDDLLCLASAIAVTAFCAVSFETYGNPLGPHQWDVSFADVNTNENLALIIVNICLYSLASIFLKSALQALYLRIFRPARRAKLLIWASIIIIILFYLIILVVDIAICAPPIAGGDLQDDLSLNDFNPDYACTVPQKPLWVAMGVFSVVTDFYLLAIPVFLTLRVRLPARRKFGVCCIFLTGLLASVFSVLATVYRFLMFASNDVTWLGALNYGFTAAELNVGIICSCMPIVCIVFYGIPKTAWWARLVNVVTFGRCRGDDRRFSSSQDLSVYQAEQGQTIRLYTPIRQPDKTYPGRLGGGFVYNELDSIDEDYHTHIKKESSSIQLPIQFPTSLEHAIKEDSYQRARTIH
ncbi:hypothetical protein GGR52DRAFT_535544 [Hypoxylon sp. FL1284]|nr:hypothetical protein GGR52DRAFT_535544 [Hypoxylon sp. FL1284]